MRLLHFDALDRLILTDFCKPIPPYAILSHRWTDSKTLIKDVSNGSYKEKEEGYRKLRFCAEQAAQDGLQYFWIDTCCIDRWDNKRALEGNQSDVPMEPERSPMLCLLVRRVNVFRDGDASTQRLAGVLLFERVAQSRMDA
jgi:hypothetical protein